MFYNGFENRGFSPNLGENYPFQFNFSVCCSQIDNHPITYPWCAPARRSSGNATFETGFSCTPLDPTLVNAKRTGSCAEFSLTTSLRTP